MKKITQPVLDELDKRILMALQENSARTNQELAELVHASAPTCFRRVKRLQDEGVIVRQIALLDPEKVGAGLCAIVEITLDTQSTDRWIEFEKLAATEAEVQQCYRVSSGCDFVLVIQVADMPGYHALAHRLFASQKNVRNVRTFFSVSRSKFEIKMVV